MDSPDTVLQIFGTIRIMEMCWQAVVKRVHVPGGQILQIAERVSGSWQLLEFGGFRLLSNKESHSISLLLGSLLGRIEGLIESLMKENR